MSFSNKILPISLDETNSTETLEDDTLNIPSDAFQLLLNSSSSSVTDETQAEWAFQVPKAIQAIATLLVCALLLIGTLGVIQQAKKWCGKGSSHDRIEKMELAVPQKSTDYSDEAHLKANGEDIESQRHSGAFSKNFMHYQPASRPQTPQNTGEPAKVQAEPKSILVKQQSLLKAPKEVFVRRTSGPFGDDAIDFYGKSYKKGSNYRPKNPRGGEPEPQSSAGDPVQPE